ncbi:hypothetical protein [Rhizobium leguminosarum]|uniref:hypothetical protein n=1 Tax=Rhizobium leguminosarum TaxID=384 RepID=UPI001AE505FE|nr:hypothetical protein [Rhizobium leguminosarum]MBP2449616.1 hypothetical protein [Rhizobium leguminosarum]
MLESFALAFVASASARNRASRSASSAAWALARSSGRESGGNDMPLQEHISSTNPMIKTLKPVSDARFPEGLSSQFQITDKKAAPV